MLFIRKAGEKAVGMVARLEEVKDHETFLLGAKRLLDKRQDVRFYIVGDGSLHKQLEQKAAALGIREHVTFTGFLQDVEKIEAALDIAVITSRAEALCLSILESMIAGIPAVGTDSGGVAEVIRHGENGFLIPVGDSDALAERLDELLTDDAKRNAFGAQAKKDAEATFLAEQMTRKIIDMTKDPRGGQFEYFRTMTDPWAGITVPVDITDLLASLNGRLFFLSYLYAVMRAANAVPELRRRLLPDGQVVEYDHCDPSYTVMKPDGTGVYVYCLLEDDLSSYEKFVAEGKRRQKETLERGTLTEDGDVLANFFVSCVPWLYYTQIKEPAGGADDSNPRFAWGKYREENGRMMLPMSLFINHALCDGWHVTQFYKNLDRELTELSAYLKTQNEQQ